MSNITGAHAVIFSKDAESDRTLFKEILKFTNVDAGGGWLIFKMPRTELAFHPAERNDIHEFYLMCDNIEEFIGQMNDHNISCEPVDNQGWGKVSSFSLPGGGKMRFYEPLHPTP